MFGKKVDKNNVLKKIVNTETKNDGDENAETIEVKKIPKIEGLEKVLLIGSGPIVIGQAAETKLA